MGLFCYNFVNKLDLSALCLLCRHCSAVDALLDTKTAVALLKASDETGLRKEELFELCLTAYLFEQLGRSGLTSLLSSHNLIQIKPDTVLN